MVTGILLLHIICSQLNGFESLKYAENSPESQINILVSLRYRYNDIMTYSEPKSEQWERAKLLSDALDEIIEERK